MTSDPPAKTNPPMTARAQREAQERQLRLRQVAALEHIAASLRHIATSAFPPQPSAGGEEE